MNWNIEDRVVHKNKPDWGVGKVLHANSQDIGVFFVNAGRKTFSQPAALLEVAPDAMHAHPLLLNVSPAVLHGASKFLPLPDCIQYFLKLFPQGFDDPTYLSPDLDGGERQYKVVASTYAKEVLGESEWRSLSDMGDYTEICLRLARIESKTNLLHSFEKIKWHAALKDIRLQKGLADALFDDLFGTDSRMAGFTNLANALGAADGCNKWTIATYYGFLIHPESRIFIKPEVTKFAAEACGWDLQYDSALNWNTLARAEGMAQYLFHELQRVGLKPRDMIDVQSFIWCIDPKSYA